MSVDFQSEVSVDTLASSFPPAELYRQARQLLAAGQGAQAIGLLQQLLQLAPTHEGALLTMADCLAARGDPAAEAAYARLLALYPNRADALNNLGVLKRASGAEAEAEALYRQALALQPHHADANGNLGRLLWRHGRAAEALPHLECAVQHQPNAERWHLLGQCRAALGRALAAELAYRSALTLDPRFVPSLNNLANLLGSQGRGEEALRYLDEALAIDPAQADVRYNRALRLLAQGRSAEGWAEHEWRWKAPGFTFPRPSLPSEPWDGRPLPDGTLLVHWEQGLGDTIQFSRYLSAAKARVGRLILVVQEPLQRLMSWISGPDLVLKPGDPIPGHERHCMMMSLPLLLGEAAGLPAPYLPVPVASAEPAGARRRIGIAWAGNPKHANDANRSCPLAALTPLFALPGIEWVCLQIGPATAAIDDGMGLGRLAEPADMAETALRMRSLDAVLCVDTALAHLAGAIGIELLLMLPHAAEWRWGDEGSRTHWYPNATLFRQQAAGDWAAVVRAVKNTLLDSRRLNGR